MNVCMIVYSCYEIDKRVIRYAETLSENGHSVDVIALKWEHDEEKRGLLNSINVYHLRNRKYNERNIFDYLFNTTLFFIKGSLLVLIKHLKKRYDIIHIHNVPDFLVFMGLFAKILGSKIILDIHDILPEFFCQKFNKDTNSYYAKLLLFVEKTSTNFADYVIVANDLWMEKIIKRDSLKRNKCSSLLNYPDMQYFSNIPPKRKKDEFILVYPGTISRHHGIDIAIKAVSIIKKEIPLIRLYIYGRSRDLAYLTFLKKLIHDLDLTQEVKFFKPVKPHKLKQIYSQTDIGVVPKRGGIFASEAFSTKIYDFMASGISVVASKTKIDEYYFDDSMIMFFQPENHGDMAECIIELFKNPEKRRILTSNAEKYIAKNTWESHKQVYLNLVDSLVNKI